MSQLVLRKTILLALSCYIVLFPAVRVHAQNNIPPEAGALSDNRIITSRVLDYDLNYRVYTPPGYENLQNLPVLYVADGQWYIRDGKMAQVMDKMIASGDIYPIIAVFVDNRNPYKPSDNRRNRQFWCNPDYSSFFEDELVPEIDARLKTNPSRESRVILGLSFGGLNAACFGLQAHETFEGIAMQSPAMRPVPSIFSDYEESPRLPLNIFLSTGTKQDNEDATRRLKSILEKKGYPLQYIEVPFSHDWRNWKPLLDDILLYFYTNS